MKQFKLTFPDERYGNITSEGHNSTGASSRVFVGSKHM